MRFFTILCGMLFMGLSSLCAQEALFRSVESLPLIPYPQEVKATSAPFRLTDRMMVYLCTDSPEDRFAAQTFTDELQQLYGCSATIKTGSGKKGAVLLTRPGADKLADERLHRAGLTIDSAFNREGYVLLADDQGVVVAANTAQGLFYGMQTLRQLTHRTAGGVAVAGVAVRDYPAMRYRWQQDDWARGPIPSLEYAKRQIRTMAAYKLNGYSIYCENNYQSKRHPLINPYGGTITPEEITELVAYGRQYHVEIVPQQQTFGHLHYILRQERYADLGEKKGSQILSPMEPGAYDFIGDYLSDILPAFESEFLHIGCDETFELGRGKSKERVEREGKAEVYMEYLSRVASLLEPHKKKLLFWGDIALEHPEYIPRLPKSLIAVAWDYLPRESYAGMLKPYADNGIPTFVAPAAFFGGRVVPMYTQQMANTRNFVRDGQQFGALGMLNTTWDDLGEDLFDMGWYPVVFAAACAWQSGTSDTDVFHDAFDWAFYRNGQGHPYAEGIAKLAAIHDKAGAVNFEMAHSSPFTPIGALTQNHITRMGIASEMRLLAEDAYQLFWQNRTQVGLNNETVDALLFGARRMDFVFHKAILARQMSDLYAAYVRDDDKGYAVNTALYDLVMPYASRLGSLRDMTKELQAFHRDLWAKENRPYHWDVIEARYLRLLMELENQYDRIQLDANQFGGTGKHLPREEVGFLFEAFDQ